MLVRVLLIVVLVGGFVLGSAGGWETARTNTEIALEKWKNYREDSATIFWPVDLLDRESLDSGRERTGELAFVKRVQTDHNRWCLIITVSKKNFDERALSQALPPWRPKSDSDYRRMLNDMRERMRNPGPPC